jgi:hypothetical protein
VGREHVRGIMKGGISVRRSSPGEPIELSGNRVSDSILVFVVCRKTLADNQFMY